MRPHLFLLAMILSLQFDRPVGAQSKPAAEDVAVLRSELVGQDAIDRRTGGHRKVHIIEMEAGKAYSITLEGGFRPHLRVESEENEILADDTADETRKTAAITFVPVEDGKYSLIVSSRTADETGVYALTVNKSHEEAALQFTGILAATDPFDKVRANCFHKVFLHKMSAGRSYVIDLMGQFDTYLRIEDSRGQNLAQDDDGGDGLNSRLIFRPAQNDTYRLIVTSCGPNAVGQFMLKVQPSPPEKLVLHVQQQLTRNDAFDKVRRGSHCKTYAVKLEAGRNYLVDLQSAQFDAYLRLEDAAGVNLAQDDDSGGGLNARLAVRPQQTAFYTVVATSLGNGSIGNFTLTVRQH